jgi:CRP-like cAMP-binding protein
MSLKITESHFAAFMHTGPLSKDLTEGEIRELAPYFEVIMLNPGGVIFEEGERSQDLYLLYEGGVVLLKQEPSQQVQSVIGSLGKGEMFGEMSFIEDAPRSCTIKADQPTILIKLSKAKFEAAPLRIKSIFVKILQNITSLVIARVRTTNASFVKARQKEANHALFQQQTGWLILQLIGALQILGTISVKSYLSGVGSQGGFIWINIFQALSLSLLIYPFIHKQILTFRELGLNLDLWRKVLSHQFLIAATGMVILWGSVNLLNNLHLVSDGQEFSWFSYIAYPFSALLLEFSLRGSLQTLLIRFMGNLAPWMLVCYVSALASVSNFYFSWQISLLVFLLHCFWGWLYLVTKNLWVVAYVHLYIVVFLKLFGILPYATFT